MAYSLVKGDLEPDMVITIAAPGALTALPTAQSVQLRWRKPDGTLATVSLTVVDANAGTVKRVWSAGDTDIIGLHRGQVVVTDANGKPTSDPNDGSWLLWQIYAQP